MDFKKELLLHRNIIRARVRELAVQISRDYSDREPIVLGVLNGVVFFFADLVREMTIPSRIDFIRATSYGSSTSSSGTVRLTKELEISIKNEPVILVEDIVDTGLTITEIVKNLREREPESIRICALIDKQERRKIEVVIDYYGFRVEEGFLIGYGLDCNEQYRYLPDIYIMR